MVKKNDQDVSTGKAVKSIFPFQGIPENIYRSILNLSPNVIVIVRVEDGAILEVNDQFCVDSGYCRKDVIGKKYRDLKLISDEDHEQIVSLLSTKGSFRNLAIHHRRKDGSVVPSLDSAQVFNLDNKLYGIHISKTIAELKNAEDTLRHETAMSEALIESLPGLFFIIDEKTRFVRWNERFMAVLGKSAKEMSRATALDLHPQERRKAAAERIRQGFLTGSFNHAESVVVNNGDEMTLLITANKIVYQGKPCLIGTCIDITEKKRVEEALKLSRENLEEVNIALRVLMNQRTDDQKKLEEKLRNNINDLVIPYLKKLKQEKLDERSKNYISILESNLQDVLYPFIKNFSYSHKNLTPQEIQIVDLIRKGHDTKEIADILNASVNTISTHRNNIRKKLNLRKSKTNLRSHILSLS